MCPIHKFVCRDTDRSHVRNAMSEAIAI
jgi:hypothetical protein